MRLLSRIQIDHVSVSDGLRRVSGRSLQAQCDQLAEYFTSLNLDRIALLADNSIDWLCVDIACQQAEICLIPLPLFFTDAQLKHALTSCAVQALVSDSVSRLQKIAGEELTVVPERIGENLQLWTLPPTHGEAQIPPHTAKITFTSGSTGQPKGVCLSAQHLITQAQRLCHEVQLEQPRHLCLLPLSTLLENVAGVYAPLLANGEVIVPNLQALGFSGSSLAQPQKMLQVISQQQPDTLIITPQLLTFFLRATEQGWQAPKSLKFVAVGGARVASSAVLDARAKGLPVYEGYGLSECASVVTLNTPQHDRPGSCGKVLAGLDVIIESGEIVVRNSVMLGYVNEPDSWEQTAFATGDLGQLDNDGFLGIAGRKRNVLISSYGRNISPEWVESELMANPVITEAVVVGDAKPHCAALLSVQSSQVSATTIQQWLDHVNARLPDYAQVKQWTLLSAPLRGDPRFMTSNGRPMRSNINDAFHDEINQMYQNPVQAKANPIYAELQTL